MDKNISDYGLDLHCSMILEEYRENLQLYEKIKEIALEKIGDIIKQNALYINALEGRVKQEESLAGKLSLKGNKYLVADDITDLVGLRVITFYNDEVDKIAGVVERLFEIDWENSVDKRKMHDISSFGYSSLHYICRIPKELYFDPECPRINEIRFEVQMRTALQHVWSVMNHDTGYKSGVEIPKEYIRSLSRLAGLLELADEQFCQIRTEITNYRRQIQNLVANGKFSEVSLNGDTFKSYLKLDPFSKLNSRIAAINQAEIHISSALPYLEVFNVIGFKTLQDIQDLIANNSDDAYELALYQLGSTDLDIISSTLAIQNLVTVYILKQGGGKKGLEKLYDIINGPSAYNATRAEYVYQCASNLKFMN